MGQKTSSKPISITFGLATITLLVLAACNKEEEKGACVRVDGADAYCMNDETDGYCSGSGYTFHEGSSCSAVGYAYYCTPTDMRKSGGTIYGSARYLRSSTCDTKKGASGGSSGSSSSSSSSGGSSTSSSSSSGTSGAPQQCSTQNVQGCSMTFCAGGGQGCYYVVDGTKISCPSCDDLTNCAKSAADRCQGN